MHEHFFGKILKINSYFRKHFMFKKIYDSGDFDYIIVSKIGLKVPLFGYVKS